MVDRYRGSAGVPTAPVARPSGPAPLSELASGVHDVAQTALQIASKKLEERNATLEAAALNDARIELEKQGGQLALDLQKNRVAGSNYVKDLEAARAPLKQAIFDKLPDRVKNSARAQQVWNDLWTSDQIGATRSATVWQAGQEKDYAIQTLDKSLMAMSARVEADPDSVTKELDGWKKYLPTQAGLLDQETLSKAETSGVQSLLQSAVRGLSKQGRFDEAKKLITDAADKLDATQRKAFENVIEDAQNDIERERLKQEKELRETQQLNGNRFEVNILDGKESRQTLRAAINRGDINPNDEPTLIRAMRAEDDRRRIEAERSKLSDAQKEEWKSWSQQARLSLESSATMTPAQFMLDPETQWAPDLYEIYKHLTPEDQRAVDKQRLEMRETGKSNNEVDRIEAMLIDEAKRLAPTNWEVGSDRKTKTKEAVALAGYLRSAARDMAPETGGAKLSPDEIRAATALAIGQMQKSMNVGADQMLPIVRWEQYNYDFKNSDFTDQTLYSDVFARLRTKLGRAPSMAEVRQAYDQAEAALQ